jgi:hypothetical protein
VPVFLVGLGGQRGLDLGDQGGVVEAGRLAERGGHGAVNAAYPDLRVRQVDETPHGVCCQEMGSEMFSDHDPSGMLTSRPVIAAGAQRGG